MEVRIESNQCSAHEKNFDTRGAMLHAPAEAYRDESPSRTPESPRELDGPNGADECAAIDGKRTM
jgi:hypothetical protein